MNRIIPTIGASLMLAASVLTDQTQVNFFAADENKEPGDEVYYDLNAEENAGANKGERQGVDPYIYVDPANTGGGGRIMIFDNDYTAPKYQRNVTPIKSE